MKIAIFGSTGRVGKEVVKRALEDGHTIYALARSPEKLPKHERLHIIQGDARNLQDVDRVIQHVDIVLSALCTDKTTVLTEAIPLIINSMEQHRLKRIVTIGTAGILQSRTEPEKFRYRSNEAKRRSTFAAEEHEKVFHLLRQSELDWTIACPTYLPDGEATGTYRVEVTVLPENGSKISVGDTAHFAYHELLEGNYIHKRVGLAY